MTQLLLVVAAVALLGIGWALLERKERKSKERELAKLGASFRLATAKAEETIARLNARTEIAADDIRFLETNIASFTGDPVRSRQFLGRVLRKLAEDFPDDPDLQAPSVPRPTTEPAIAL